MKSFTAANEATPYFSSVFEGAALVTPSHSVDVMAMVLMCLFVCGFGSALIFGIVKVVKGGNEETSPRAKKAKAEKKQALEDGADMIDRAFAVPTEPASEPASESAPVASWMHGAPELDMDDLPAELR